MRIAILKTQANPTSLSPNTSLKDNSNELSQIPKGTSLNNNIMPNLRGELQVGFNSNFKHCSTKYNTFTIPKHLNSRMI